MIKLARKRLEDVTYLQVITSITNSSRELQKRLTYIELMRKVDLSDVRLDPHEQHLMRKTKGFLLVHNPNTSRQDSRLNNHCPFKPRYDVQLVQEICTATE